MTMRLDRSSPVDHEPDNQRNRKQNKQLKEKFPWLGSLAGLLSAIVVSLNKGIDHPGSPLVNQGQVLGQKGLGL